MSLNPEKIYKWGQAILVSSAIIGGSVALGTKAVSTVRAGPEAKASIAAIDKRVTRLERQMRFVVRGMEKLTQTRYQREVGESD